MKTFQLMLLATLSMSLMIGCSKSGAGSTPKETLKNFRDGFVNKDAAAMVACFDTNDTNKEAIAATCDMAVAMISFTEKMTAEYGKDAGGMKGSNSLDALKDDKWLDELKIKENGDKAVATPPKGDKMHMIKKDGKWYIDVETMTEGKTKPEEMKKMVKMAKAMTDAFNKCAKNIGKEGYDAKKVQKEMMAEMFKTAMQQSK